MMNSFFSISYLPALIPTFCKIRKGKGVPVQVLWWSRIPGIGKKPHDVYTAGYPSIQTPGWAGYPAGYGQLILTLPVLVKCAGCVALQCATGNSFKIVIAPCR
jgi:hypothetical protein